MRCSDASSLNVRRVYVDFLLRFLLKALASAAACRLDELACSIAAVTSAAETTDESARSETSLLDSPASLIEHGTQMDVLVVSSSSVGLRAREVVLPGAAMSASERHSTERQ
jgi:hypothetical protein